MKMDLSNLKDFFNSCRIIYNSGDGNMRFKYEKELKMNNDIILTYHEDLSYAVESGETEEKPFYYYIVKDFYAFLISEIISLEDNIKDFTDEMDKEYLLSRCANFKEGFNFNKFYDEYLENLMISLDENSVVKLSKIIDLTKKEYGIFKKMDPDFTIFNEMADWIEDAFFMLRKHIENLALSQKVDYKEVSSCYNNNTETEVYIEDIPYAA